MHSFALKVRHDDIFPIEIGAATITAYRTQASVAGVPVIAMVVSMAHLPRVHHLFQYPSRPLPPNGPRRQKAERNKS